jgi:hypothetical protein
LSNSKGIPTADGTGSSLYTTYLRRPGTFVVALQSLDEPTADEEGLTKHPLNGLLEFEEYEAEEALV